jgi:hypothetical protein
MLKTLANFFKNQTLNMIKKNKQRIPRMLGMLAKTNKIWSWHDVKDTIRLLECQKKYATTTTWNATKDTRRLHAC